MSGRIAKMGPFELISEGRELPVFAFKIADPQASYTVFDLTERLRTRGWLVPAYTFPENRQDLAVLRIVVRAGMWRDMADLFLDAVRKQTASLEALKAPLPRRSTEEVSAFKH